MIENSILTKRLRFRFSCGTWIPTDTKNKAGLTVSGDIELNQIFKVLDIRWQPLDLVVAEAETTESVQAKEVLKQRRGPD